MSEDGMLNNRAAQFIRMEREIVALKESLAKSESLTSEAVSREGARWRASVRWAHDLIARLVADEESNIDSFDAEQFLKEAAGLLASDSSDWLAAHDAEVVRPILERVLSMPFMVYTRFQKNGAEEFLPKAAVVALFAPAPAANGEGL